MLLNLEPDHLDRYESFEGYRDAKLRIFERAKTKIVPRGLGLEGTEFAADDPLPAEPRIPGAHNRENAAAATAAARALGIGDEAIAEALRTFPGVPHRLELVRELDGVRYVNDSKATNVAAALKALAAYERDPVHLILGGSRKGEDFAPLAAAIGPNVKSVHVIGETADELAAAIPQAERAGDLAGALAAIRAASRRRGAPFSGLRELRPVPRLRGAGRGVQEAGAEPVRVKRGQLDSSVLILVTLGLVAFGLVMVYSATSASAALANGDPAYYLKRQGIYAALGLVLMAAASRLDFRILRRLAPVLVVASLGLLLAVLVIGQSVNGARRWLTFGPAVFQPSELAKIALAVWAASYLTRHRPPQSLSRALATSRPAHRGLLRPAARRA